ncbi:MAG: amidinotransferase [Flavobacteriales bacterium]|nr:MAG: amidinotransferase [Flavobacteriales bacterium]
MNLNIQNETAKLKEVILGQPQSNGKVPTLAECYDAKSYHTVENGVYPTEQDIIDEMEGFRAVLEKHGVKVHRPEIIKNCNQVFSRDVSFVIEDKLIIANMISDRAEEQKAYQAIYDKINKENIVYLPENATAEGGDVMPWNDYIFVGVCYQEHMDKIKTARTNKSAVDFLQELFPNKKVIGLELKKHDTNPYKGILHLDCTFNIVGEGKCIIYKDGFVNKKDYDVLVEIFGKENCFEITEEEMFEMNPNIFSISPKVVVSDAAFTRMNQQLRDWGITVEEIPYREISKMGGLLRCSTMPLVRE